MNDFVSVAAVLSWLLVGALLAGPSLGSDRPRSGESNRFFRALGVVAFAPPFGLAAVACFTFLRLHAGWEFGDRARVLQVVFVLAALGCLLWLRFRSRADSESSARFETQGEGVLALNSGRSKWGALVALVFVFVGLAFGVGAKQRETSPFGTGDALNIWNVRARVLLRSGPEAREWFLNERRGHPDYPIGPSAAMAGLYSSAGEESPRVGVLVSVLLVLSCSLLLFCELAPLSPWWALAAVLSWLTLPTAWLWGFSQSADIWVSCFVLAVVVVAQRRIRSFASRKGDEARQPPSRIEGSALGLGFLLGSLGNLKHEGIVLAAVVAGCYLLWIMWHETVGTLASECFLLLGGALLPLSCLVTFKTLWVSQSEVAQYESLGLLSHLLSPERWWEVLLALGQRVNPFNPDWGAFWIILLIFGLGLGAGARARRSGAEWRRERQEAPSADPSKGGLAPWALGPLCLAGAVYAGLYVTTPYPQAWHIETSIDRLLLQLAPWALWVVFEATARLGASAAKTLASRS